MSKRAAFASLALSVFLVGAGAVRRSGEWEVTVDNGRPRVVCFPTDQTFDQQTLTRAMAKIPGSSCTMTTLTTVGDVLTFATQCAVQGTTISTNGTITRTGPDAFISKVHSHGGAVKLPSGQTYTIPDMDIVNVSRRLGPCKPGDHQVSP
jgi:hypothetical protein